MLNSFNFIAKIEKFDTNIDDWSIVLKDQILENPCRW